jgi:hypothetical protein
MFPHEGSRIVTGRLIDTEQRDIDDRIRAHGLDPASFDYRMQASETITRYVRTPPRVFGKHLPADALALYPKNRKDLYMTLERDPQLGFRSSFRPALRCGLSASVLTWEELMGVLELWLKRMARDGGLPGKRTVRPAPQRAHRGKTLNRR